MIWLQYWLVVPLPALLVRNKGPGKGQEDREREGGQEYAKCELVHLSKCFPKSPPPTMSLPQLSPSQRCELEEHFLTTESPGITGLPRVASPGSRNCWGATPAPTTPQQQTLQPLQPQRTTERDEDEVRYSDGDDEGIISWAGRGTGLYTWHPYITKHVISHNSFRYRGG